ncbi:hypothetical protein, partial [Nocardioides sp. AX2bis]|uniref:hypothetical protein n=1 Tax=Nocardioides sp. AX2bis TaxID=2653157 RepID=UPI001915FBDF
MSTRRWATSLLAVPAVLPAVLLAVLATPPSVAVATETPTPPVPTTPPTPTPTAAPDAAFEVDDAQLRWGVNDETNNRAFAPGTYNFLSAGLVPDPGRGGQTIRDRVWQGTTTTAWWAERGDVRIEKLLDGEYRPATFAGLSTTTSGTPLVGTNGPFSGHQVVIDGGTGSVDLEAGTASIAWDGSFSVVLYSGMSFFTVTDPELTVTPRATTLTGTLAGYASSRDDADQWGAVAPQEVVLATAPAADLAAGTGFTATPDYRQVRYDAPGAAVDQVRTGSDWGSFPPSFVRYQQRVGSAAYWYSSGGAADRHKVALPLTVSYAAGDPVDVPTPTGPTTAPVVEQPSVPD